MQTRQRRNPANNNMNEDPANESDATDATGAAGTNLFSPPNVHRNATDPAGVNVTPLTAQRRTAPGGFRIYCEHSFKGGLQLPIHKSLGNPTLTPIQIRAEFLLSLELNKIPRINNSPLPISCSNYFSNNRPFHHLHHSTNHLQSIPTWPPSWR
jgi:hypothetical protein